jgi:hypothetical protein
MAASELYKKKDSHQTGGRGQKGQAISSVSRGHDR